MMDRNTCIRLYSFVRSCIHSVKDDLSKMPSYIRTSHMSRQGLDWLRWRLALRQRHRGGSCWLQQVSGGVWRGGEDGCAALPGSSTHHLTVRPCKVWARFQKQRTSCLSARLRRASRQRSGRWSNNVVYPGQETTRSRPTVASMNNQSNITIDPRCMEKPPLAMDIILSE